MNACADLELTCMDENKIRPKVYILVTGETGAGKSTFIANAMSDGDPTPEIGYGLASGM